ncbi:DUF4147 domain-containing protein [Sphingobium sp. H39-3-25]|uniref:glycerate kinase type-2 family protein n=1 Tax=Sphingobium arseniciresistens TaxID=3030834 RepID=UPI0023B8EC38|nr:DUF4147 domain-containing protein [Sphingobium arseniciresistens]
MADFIALHKFGGMTMCLTDSDISISSALPSHGGIIHPLRRAGNGRKILTSLFVAAVHATRGYDLLRSRSTCDGRTWHYTHPDGARDWSVPPSGRVVVVGPGKAVASLARGLEAVLGDRITDGCVIVKYDHVEPLSHIELLEAGHPAPDAAGVAAPQALLSRLGGLTADDRVFILLTAWASALSLSPTAGLTLEDKVDTTNILLASGASILEINTLRKCLSKVKGGRLLDAIGPAASMTLMISDVPTHDPAMVGSGPTCPDASMPDEELAIIKRYGVAEKLPARVVECLRQPDVRTQSRTGHGSAQHIIVADAAATLDAVAQAARDCGLDLEVIDPRMNGDTHDTAHRFASTVRARPDARRPGDPTVVLLASGETTLEVTGSGKGGRNQEFALLAAMDLVGVLGATPLLSGTNRTDGPTDAARAFADGETMSRAHLAGIDAPALLANNDSCRFFSEVGDLFITGPTGTNDMDLVIALID